MEKFNNISLSELECLNPYLGSSLPVSSTIPSTSYRSRGTLERSLDARAAVLQQADKLVDRLNNIRRGQVCLVHVCKTAFIGYPVTSLPNHLATKKYVSY